MTWGNWPVWGDQGDETYANPVSPGDWSDIDCVRVGADYWAISSTFQFSPGMAVLHSRDLVNWTIAGHVIHDLTQIGPELNWDKMARYGRGVWAGAIRHHQNKFWVYFGTPDEGYFVTTAPHPAGPWEPLHPVLASAGWDDCCPFWDDDGRGYLVGTNFSDGYKIHLWQLTPDGRDVIQGSGRVIHQSKGSEASKLYKINGWYYHLFSRSTPEGRVLLMERAREIVGPYHEEKQLCPVDKKNNEPNQGGLVQTQTGDWFFLTHHGTGAWEGRCLSLLPVCWVDGWPMIGVGPDNTGGMVWSGKKPVQNTPRLTPQTSDEFNTSELSPQWEWNYQPRPEKWSLRERPGWLRLCAFAPLSPNALLQAGNTLTQRSFRTVSNEAVVKLDISGMKSGQKAGLCHFAHPHHCALGVRQNGNVRVLEYRQNGVMTGPTLTHPLLWLKSTWGLNGLSRFSVSTNGTNFLPFGGPYQLKWGAYRGDRIGIYCFNDEADAGFVDVDFFHYVF